MTAQAKSVAPAKMHNNERREDMAFNGGDFRHDLEQPLDAKGQPLYDAVSRTKQEFMSECDITVIMNNILKGVQQTSLTPRMYEFSDRSMRPNLHDALNVLTQAQQQFDQLPATTRDFFRNDPMELDKFLTDEKNYDKALELGLVSSDLAEARASNIAAAEAAKDAAEFHKSAKVAAKKPVDSQP